MNIEKIETNRLYLRPFTKDDALFAISIWNDPEMGEYLGDPALETIDPEYVKEIEALGDDPICCYLIAESKTTGERIGTCSFIPLKDQTVYDIAYCVNKLHWRKGYATEMIQGMIAYAKAHSGKRITVNIDPDNAASNGVVKKLGFKVVHTGSYVKRGENKVCPEYTYELLLS